MLKTLAEMGRRLPLGSKSRRLAGMILRGIRRRWHRRYGVPWLVAGHRLRFALGTEPHYLELTENEVQRKNVEQLGAFASCLKPGDLVVDAGAFVGLYTLLAAKVVGVGGRVIAFEPVPESAAHLHANVVLNALDGRVTIETLALGVSHATHVMQSWGASSVNTLTEASILPESVLIKVVTESLDSYCRRCKVRPDWVKIDVEGWELQVLQGMRSLLHGPVGVLCEMHPHLWHTDTESQLSALLAACGRTIRDLHGGPVSQIGYGPYFIMPQQADVPRS